MGKQRKKKSDWVLVCVDELPIPSLSELEAARRRWVDKQVWFFVGSEQWRRGMVYAITRRRDVKIAVRSADAWVHHRVIRLEYVPRVLANSGK